MLVLDDELFEDVDVEDTLTGVAESVELSQYGTKSCIALSSAGTSNKMAVWVLRSELQVCCNTAVVLATSATKVSDAA